MISLRNAAPSDVQFLSDAFVTALHGPITAVRGTWNEARERAQFREQLELSRTRVVEVDGIAVGFVMAVPKGADIELHTLCIAPTYQARGFGSEVVAAVLCSARQDGLGVVLSVLKSNGRARGFFEHLGFAHIGESEYHHRFRHRGAYDPQLTISRELVSQVIEIVTRWARSRVDVLGLALVGSQARGSAGERSDIDLLFLVDDPSQFQASNIWLAEVQWVSIGSAVVTCRDKTYGDVWSRHVGLSGGLDVEFTFAGASWARTGPIEPGTLRVVSDGFRVLFDRRGLLSSLVASAA